MARKSSPPPKPARRLSPEEKRSALARIESRIEELSKLEPSKIQRGDDESVQSISSRIASTLAGIYGEDSAEFERLRIAADLDATFYSALIENSPKDFQEGVERGKARALAVLRGEAHSLREELQFTASLTPTPAAKPSASDEVFIVHGQDSPANIEVARLIERAGLKAITCTNNPTRAARSSKNSKHMAAPRALLS
jgi:hypothetical protein